MEEILKNGKESIEYLKNKVERGKTMRIKQKISYTVEFTEEQLKVFYNILKCLKDDRKLATDNELIPIYHELQKMFDDYK
jgi:hypothetical protein